MKALSTINILSAAVIVALIFSLSTTADVVADDVTPPSTPTEETVLPLEETPPTLTEEVLPPAEETPPAPTEEVFSPPGEIPPTPTEEVPELTEEALIEQSVESESTISTLSIMEQLPEGTSLIVETQDGIEPLATVRAADLIVVGDPIWCPEGAAPIAGSGGCSSSFTSLASLVYTIPAEPAGNGVIWITSGADTSASFISIDGNVFTNWKNFNLTINGGWNGDALGTITSITTFDRPIEIVNWSGNIGVNNISVENTNSTGLSISTDGDVTLNNLSLNGNSATGLSVNSGGVVLADGIIAENNGSGGVIGYGAEFVANELELTGINEFNGNAETGLYADINGNITVSNLTATGNGTGSYGGGAELVSAGDITMQGINQFNDNNGTGLYLEAVGEIVSQNIVANNNNGVGAEFIANSLDLSGTNEFNGNHASGMFVDVTDDITISDVTANNNGVGVYGVGAELITALGDVTILGVNQFSGNNASGLYIQSVGNVIAQNVTANNNGTSGSYGYGAEIVGSGLTLSGTNVFNGNHESGMYAQIAGNVTIANMAATYNGQNGGYGLGAELVSAGLMQLSGVNIFSNNSSGGLYVDAVNGIMISNTEVNGNLDTGLYLSSTGGVFLDCSKIIGNNGYGMDVNAPTLILNGVEVRDNTQGDILAGGSVSTFFNSCFTGSSPVTEESEDGVIPLISAQTQSINSLLALSGESLILDCKLFGGTTITLSNGDGAYLPCGFGEEARLIFLERDSLPGDLPRGVSYISSLNLVVMKESMPIQPLGEDGVIWEWFVGEDDEGQPITQALFWDGANWVEADADSIPFVRVFFHVPDTLNDANLAIMFWDGTRWVELTDGLNLGDGRFVRIGKRINGVYEVEVNFTGTFVLVQK